MVREQKQNSGHCKTINNLEKESYIAGESLSAYQGAVLKQNLDTLNENFEELVNETLPSSLSEKENIVNKTNVLDENSTVNQYPNAKITYEKYSELLNQIPTATATGNPINVQDSSNLPLVDFAMSGNATQVTTTGKNLMPNTITTQTINGVTFTKNSDGTISTSGTASANAILSLSTSIPLTAGTYWLTGCPSGRR